jgi:hypothetical protein
MVHRYKYDMPTEKDALIVEINRLSRENNIATLSVSDLRKYRDLLKKAKTDVWGRPIPKRKSAIQIVADEAERRYG